MAKTTKKHFEIFKNECQKWIDKFQLNGWKIYFEYGGTNKNSYSTIRNNLIGHVATISFTKEWSMVGINNINKGIKETAKHEIIHLLLARFSEIGSARYTTNDEFYEAEEELVRKLEKIIN